MSTLLKDGGVTASIWIEPDGPRHDTPPPHEVECCVIGAGIAGLTTALVLARGGTRVAVLDDGPIGGGETGRTSAHLASAVDDHYYELESRFGADGARAVAESHAAAIDWIEAFVREHGVDCDFRRVDGYLVAPPDEPERWRERLERELVAAARAGLTVERVERSPLPFDRGPALRFADQAEFHPLRYLRALAEAVIAAGGTIHTGRAVHVERIAPAEPLTLELSGGRTVRCLTAVDATNGAMSSPVKLALRQAAYRTYCMAFEVPRGALPRALYWDTCDPYHYIRLAAGPGGGELMIVGGSDHRTGQGEPMQAWLELEHWTRQWLPFAGAAVARWSGQVIEPVDGPAHIGRSPGLPHVDVVTGDSGNGLTHGTIAGLLLPRLMRGEASPWEDVYSPDRSHLHSLGSLVKEAAHSSLPYADWLRGSEVGALDEIACGQGAIVRRGLHLVAVYRDPSGALHQRSATCPHLRGVVKWNPGEETWDCPCHGSRFDPYGRVLNGPAAADLAAIDALDEPRPRVAAGEAPAAAPPVPAARPDPGSRR